MIGGLAPDGNALPVVEPFERALPDILGDRQASFHRSISRMPRQHAPALNGDDASRLALDDQCGHANARKL